MKLNRKQKEFKRMHKYAIINVNGLTLKLDKDNKCVPALPDEIGTFIMFTPKTFIGEIKKDFVNIGEIIRFKHAIFRKFQFKVLCDTKSKLHNGQKHYVLTDLNGDYKVVNRDGFKMLKNRGLVSKKATFIDLMKEAVYVSPDNNKR